MGVLNTPSAEEIVLLATNHQAENTILSTVSHDWGVELSAAWPRGRRFLELTAGTPLPIRNTYGTPETLGKDRLAAVVAAFYRYPRENCLVVDAGTCITFEVLTADGRYLGGNISPGIRMRLRAMHDFTARLPLVEPDALIQPWGATTKEALQNGGALGAALELEGLANRLRRRWSPLRTLLTGGDGPLLASLVKTEIFVHENLVLEGLNKILEYNVEQLA